MNPSEVIAGPMGSSQLLAVLQGGPLVPCHVPQLVNLKGPGKMYICEQCEKQTSTWDSMVPHCHSKASWDPSSLSPMQDELFESCESSVSNDREVHNLLFH